MLNAAAQPRDTFGKAIIMINDTILTIWCNPAHLSGQGTVFKYIMSLVSGTLGPPIASVSKY